VKRKPLKARKLIFDKKGVISLATRIKELREAHDITQEQLSEKSGLSVSQIARLETARINPSVSTVFAVARALNIELKELFDFKLD